MSIDCLIFSSGDLKCHKQFDSKGLARTTIYKDLKDFYVASYQFFISSCMAAHAVFLTKWELDYYRDVDEYSAQTTPTLLDAHTSYMCQSVHACIHKSSPVGGSLVLEVMEIFLQWLH